MAILGLVTWTMLLLTAIAILRTGLTVSGVRAANNFSPSGEDVSPFSARLCRAHANCFEFLPFALAILLYAVATNQTTTTDGLALVLLAARMLQSTIHLVSTSRLAVALRFACVVPQFAIVFLWIAKLV
ncbi:MAPEG family protein [uncultured Roseibium sp.]|uniref:MAPEG family protein n=1 Tax=uncultured Roseibium sp. TaxID=1936171 RepID=UPI0032179160